MGMTPLNQNQGVGQLKPTFVNPSKTESAKTDPKAEAHVNNTIPVALKSSIVSGSINRITDNVTILTLKNNPETKQFKDDDSYQINDFKNNNADIKEVKNAQGNVTGYQVTLTKKMDKASAAELSKEDNQLKDAAKKNPSIFEDTENTTLNNHRFDVQQSIFKSKIQGYQKGDVLVEMSGKVNGRGGREGYEFNVKGLGVNATIHPKEPYLTAEDILIKINDSKITSTPHTHVENTIPNELRGSIKPGSIKSLTDNVTIVELKNNPETKRFYDDDSYELKDYKNNSADVKEIKDGQGKVTGYQVTLIKNMDKASPSELAREDKQLKDAAIKNPSFFEDIDKSLSGHIFYMQQDLFKSAIQGYQRGDILPSKSEMTKEGIYFKLPIRGQGRNIDINSKTPYVEAKDILRVINDSKVTGGKEFNLD